MIPLRNRVSRTCSSPAGSAMLTPGAVTVTVTRRHVPSGSRPAASANARTLRAKRFWKPANDFCRAFVAFSNGPPATRIDAKFWLLASPEKNSGMPHRLPAPRRQACSSWIQPGMPVALGPGTWVMPLEMSRTSPSVPTCVGKVRSVSVRRSRDCASDSPSMSGVTWAAVTPGACSRMYAIFAWMAATVPMLRNTLRQNSRSSWTGQKSGSPRLTVRSVLHFRCRTRS